jgi:hypothetical protein
MSGQIRAVYLSPHQDDICFSLGALAWKIRRGVLVNVFSISNYTDEALHLPLDSHLVSSIRDREDDEFALQCELTKYNLDQLDSPLRNRRPYDRTDHLVEVEQLSPILSRCLANFMSLRDKLLLFCPTGIGMHRDHLIVRDVILRDYERLCPTFDIVFYEDLHYASRISSREEGLREFLEVTAKWRYRKRYKFGVTADKLDLIWHYKSQFENLPTDLSLFTPADGSNSPHEAVWTNGRIEALEGLESVRLGPRRSG